MDAASFALGYEHGRAIGRGPVGGGTQLGDFYGWQAADLDAAIAEAGDNLVLGTRLATTEQDWYTLVQDAPVGTHYLPRAVPVSTTQAVPGVSGITTAWRGVDPVVAGVSDWDKANGASGAYSVDDGVFTLASSGANTGRINYDDGVAKLDGPHLIVIDRLSATCQAGLIASFPQLQFRFQQSDRILQLRPGGATASDVWGVATSTTNLDIVGATIGDEHRVEVYVNPTTQQVRVRVDGGAWQAFAPTMNTVAGGTTSAAFLAPDNSGVQSISLAAPLIASAT